MDGRNSPGAGGVIGARGALRAVAHVGLQVLHHHQLEPAPREGERVAGRRFDLVLWNPPFFTGPAETPFDIAWRSDDAIDRFAAALPRHLAPQGTALLIWSSQGDTQALRARLDAHGLAVDVLRRAHFGVERFTIYALRPRPG